MESMPNLLYISIQMDGLSGAVSHNRPAYSCHTRCKATACVSASITPECPVVQSKSGTASPNWSVVSNSGATPQQLHQHSLRGEQTSHHPVCLPLFVVRVSFFHFDAQIVVFAGKAQKQFFHLSVVEAAYAFDIKVSIR